MKALIIWACCFFLIGFAPLTLAQISMGEAIDRAGQQRMLSQRIAQNYLLAAIQPGSAKGMDRMQRAIQIFERNMLELENFSGAAPLKAELNEVKALWLNYKAVAQGVVNKANAEQLLRDSDTLLAAAHHYVKQLEQLASGKSAELVNISGRQRMLSQRIAKNYLAYFYKLGGEERIRALYEDLAEYENVLGYLKESELNTLEINVKLKKVEGQFNYASKGFDGLMQLTGDRLIYVITGTTDAMLKNMDDVTKMYAALN